jgi:ubiquinone/menaquinone biosynthesis C-methylase UbiE/uncharacterized protein YbaR (Trm112 family)
MTAIDPYVQRWVAGTNGRMYEPLIGKLKRYPIPVWPGRKAAGKPSLLLDIGVGWGRWMVSAARAGYVPVGIDIKLDGLQATRRVLREHGVRGYVVGADLKTLPFQDGIFDHVYSYSVIQHVHRDWARACFHEIGRVLHGGGQCTLEFPLRTGIANYLLHCRKPRPEEDDYQSWCVRYYTIEELKAALKPVLENLSTKVDCYFGIGIKAEDMDILPKRYWPVVLMSEALRRVSTVIRPLVRIADSVYIMGRRAGDSNGRHQPAVQLTDDNLAIAPLLRCPSCHGRVRVNEPRSEVVCEREGLRYPVEDGVPMMIVEAAVRA